MADNLFSQVYEEDNIFIIFDDIVNHCDDWTATTHQYTLTVPNNVVNTIKETTKG